MRTCFLLFTVTLTIGVPGLTHAASPDIQCLNLFKSKQYMKAGECFESLVQAIGPSQGLSEKKKNFKGRMLRNAALAFRKHALQVTPAKGAKWRMRALKHLKAYQQDKLCETAERCRITAALAQSIRREVGYTPLTVTTGSPNTSVEINGDAFTDKGKGNQLKWKVPPGEYVVVVTRPGKSPISKKITVKKGQPGLLDFKPVVKVQPLPTPKTRSSAPMIMLLAGGGVLLVGGALLITGVALNGGLQASADKLKADKASNNQVPSQSDTDNLLGQYSTQQTLATAGFIGLGVGAAIAIGGLIWGGAQGGFAATKTASLPRKSPALAQKIRDKGHPSHSQLHKFTLSTW